MRTLAIVFGLSLTMAAQQLPGLIPTPIDQWRPVEPGIWTISTKQFTSGDGQSPQTMQELSGCPYSSLLFLHANRPAKLSEAGCQFQTFRMSETLYHVVARCKALQGQVLSETTTISVSANGRAFSSVTSWPEARGVIAIHKEGTLASACERK